MALPAMSYYLETGYAIVLQDAAARFAKGIENVCKMASTIRTKAHRRLVALFTEARQRSGLRQVEVAKKLGRSQTWIARVESGERRIDVVEFYQMARLFDLDPHRLISRIWRELD